MISLRLCASKEVTSSELLRDALYLVIWNKTPGEIVGGDRRHLLAEAAARFGGVRL